MKCPKCGYVSFDYLDNCKRCGGNLLSLKKDLNILSVVPKTESTDESVSKLGTDIAETEGMIDTSEPLIQPAAEALREEPLGEEIDHKEGLKGAMDLGLEEAMEKALAAEEDLEKGLLGDVEEPSPAEDEELPEFELEESDTVEKLGLKEESEAAVAVPEFTLEEEPVESLGKAEADAEVEIPELHVGDEIPELLLEEEPVESVKERESGPEMEIPELDMGDEMPELTLEEEPVEAVEERKTTPEIEIPELYTDEEISIGLGDEEALETGPPEEDFELSALEIESPSEESPIPAEPEKEVETIYLDASDIEIIEPDEEESSSPEKGLDGK